MLKGTVKLFFIAGLLISFGFCISAQAKVTPKVEAAPSLLQPRTVKSAEFFSLEAATRCSVRVDEQNLITTVPFKASAFRLESDTSSDALPKFMVTGYTFDQLPLDVVLANLLKGIGIQVVAAKGAYPVISGKDIKGELSSVINKITSAAGLFYAYDAQNKYLKIIRNNKWRLYVPASRPVMIAVLDALRGTGIHDIVPDWEDKFISFTGGTDVEEKVKKLIGFFDDGTTIVAYDVSVYRILPDNKMKQMNWQYMVNHFGTDSIRSNLKGLVGRLIVSGASEISNPAFVNFVSSYSDIMPIAEGVVMIPDGWSSRFDVGRCGDLSNPESQLSVLVKATLNTDGQIAGSVALDTSKGEITNFPSFVTDIGDSVIIFGIPMDILAPSLPGSEIAIFMTPKIIRIVKEAYGW